MAAKQEIKFDVNTYRPLRNEDIVYIETQMPTREFGPEEDVKWTSSINLVGTVFINVIHKDYPDASYQMQCVQDGEENWHVFFAHVSPSNHHIPDELSETLVAEIFPQVMERLQRGKPS